MDLSRRPEAIDTRIVFWTYAVLAGVLGLILAGWGPRWLGAGIADPPWNVAPLIRVLGSILIAAGCCAMALAAVDSPPSRHRGLFWFAAGHAVIWIVLVVQGLAVWGPGLGDRAAQVLWIVAIVLFYLWATAEGEFVPWTLIGLFGGTVPRQAERIRSQYEQQIRQAAGQEERNRLARDLHDSIKQQIFVIQTAAATAQVRYHEDRTGAEEALEQVRCSAREAMAEMEAMLDQLRSASLENAGLVEALKRQCEALGFRTGARVEFNFGKLPPSESLAPGAHQAFLRVAQEALSNVARHARASSVAVSLDNLHGRVVLTVNDDGAGFDPNRSARGMGVTNMRARADEFGGEFELISRPGGGTKVRFTLPYATVTPREYRKKAVAFGLVSAVTMLYYIWTKDPNMAVIAAAAAIGCLRYAVAFRRTQKQRGAAQ